MWAAGLNPGETVCSAGVDNILDSAFGRDASQLAMAEKRDLLERMLGRLAHEIRNPLSSLDVHVQLLEEDLEAIAAAVPPRLSSRLEIIKGELHRLGSIVDHFVRLAGPSAVEPEDLDMRGLCRRVCDLLRPEVASRQIELICDSLESVPEIRGDPVRLTQVLLNLLINAIQAVERNGRVFVRISTTADSGFVRVDISDTGPGLPPGKLGVLFDPFFTTKAEGSGLGLWIAQQIIIAHGGRLEARNGEEGGAVFMIWLPVAGKEAVSG
jgi:signal transduction histidine kinase